MLSGLDPRDLGSLAQWRASTFTPAANARVTNPPTRSPQLAPHATRCSHAHLPRTHAHTRTSSLSRTLFATARATAVLPRATHAPCGPRAPKPKTTSDEPALVSLLLQPDEEKVWGTNDAAPATPDMLAARPRLGWACWLCRAACSCRCWQTHPTIAVPVHILSEATLEACIYNIVHIYIHTGPCRRAHPSSANLFTARRRALPLRASPPR